MKPIHALLLSSAILFGTVTVIGCDWASEAQDVAKQEVYPKALLKKYEWFKDSAAACDRLQANIKVYESRIKSLNEVYIGQPRSKWTRTDAEQMNIWQSELAGVKAVYNSTASDYNSQMSKANWEFCNVGKLPPGSTTPLPREFKPYIEQ